MIRLLPATRTPRTDLGMLAESWGFSPAGSSSGGEGVPRQEGWQAPDGTVMYWVGDDILGLEYVVVDGAATDVIAGRLEDDLPAKPWREVLTEFTEDLEWHDLIPAVYRLAISAPAVAEPLVLSLLSRLASHEHPMVRQASYVATSYIGWPELRALLTQAIEDDDVAEGRELARRLLPAVPVVDGEASE